MHFVDDQSTSRLLYSLLLHRADETHPGRNSCPQLQFFRILGFQFVLYRVAILLSLRHVNQPCFIVMFLFLDDQIFYSSYVYRQHFSLRPLASLYFNKCFFILGP